MNAGRTVFAQLMDLLPRRAFESAVERHDGHARPCRLSCMDQLLRMAFAQLTGRTSLRETVTCLRALGPRRYRCGIRVRPARSTLAEANERRDPRIYSDTAMAMVAAARIGLPVDPDLRRLGIAAAFAVDSTTIDLCLKLFPRAHFRRRQAGIKAHVMLDLRVGIPVFMRVSDAKTSDVSVPDHISFEAGAFYVLDRGYVDFARLYRIRVAGAFFVTRAKRGMDFGVRQRVPVAPGGPVTHDQLIRLPEAYIEAIRCILRQRAGGAGSLAIRDWLLSGPRIDDLELPDRKQSTMRPVDFDDPGDQPPPQPNL